ncbi:MAG: DUF5682 family protein [Phormidesmis sp.]
MTTTIFGIRHHGPGSARSLVRSLQFLNPDIILVEGPPEATDSLSLLAEADMKPPVALLIYPPDHLQQSAYYPFAVFSPEWQAIQHGLQRSIPVRFMDLPQTHQMAERIANQLLATSSEDTSLEEETSQKEAAEEDAAGEEATNISESNERETTESLAKSQTEKPEALGNRQVVLDPLALLAEAAGYTDSERWWEHVVEQRQNDTALFEGILEAIATLRKEIEAEHSPSLANPSYRREAQREAYMRKTIRRAIKEGFQNIAVVCGAWHAPALVDPFPSQKEDNAVLKGLSTLKVKATWIPWTYARLSTESGYGAGVTSPGWYHHLWQSSRQSSGLSHTDTQNTGTQNTGTQSAIRWLTRVARLLRTEDLDASAASVIEAVRLAEALAAVREIAAPGLEELNEATQTVLCFGDPTPLTLIHRKLIVSDRLGQVPESTPLVPLQQDLQRLQKRLRLKPEATERLLNLDLRKDLDLARSHLLHRLRLLKIDWGLPQRTSGKGTFKEAWKLDWQPELSLAMIEAGRWGNTLEEAAAAYVRHEADEATALPALTHLLDRVLLANLPGAIAHLMRQLQNAAAIASDVAYLMAALPPLVNVLRYRDVRQTNSTMVKDVVDGLVVRICIGLPGACAALNDKAAAKMRDAIAETHRAIKQLQQEQYAKSWSAVLRQLCDRAGLHGLIAGYSCRLLLDENSFHPAEAARLLGLALSLTNKPTAAAAWVEGFLQGSGLLLLHDDDIWQVLDDWVSGLSDSAFTALLPLLRRTFSSFPAPERRQMGERVRLGTKRLVGVVADRDFDRDRAANSLPLIAQLLGISFKPQPVAPQPVTPQSAKS